MKRNETLILCLSGSNCLIDIPAGSEGLRRGDPLKNNFPIK
ncbi:hypothetical protein WMO41_01705 [Ventrimonas sp. CLA-AP-H27]|uniref:MBL fold metallo-hydrolase n=1 Tax=Ventrimonas faecis TaxID=3133170 RepID=A0ABV1HIX2_9FIRM